MTLGWAFVGTGRLAEGTIAPAVQEQVDSKIVAAFDVDWARAAAFSDRWGARACREYAEVLEDPSVDIVYVATPNAYHADRAIAALEAGKHVLCEKPMALRLSEGQSMVAMAAKVGRLLGVGFHLRHKPSNRIGRELVSSGRIGRVFLAELERGSSKTAFPHDGWRSQPHISGGGSIMNQGEHLVDLVRYLTGREIVSVSARADREPIEDVMAAVCTLEGGALATLASHQLWWNTRPDFALLGERGWVRGAGTCSPTPNDVVEIHDESGTTVIQGSDRSPYWCEVDDFVQAVLGRAALNGDGMDGLCAIAVVEALYRSVREGCSVDVKPVG